MEFKWKRVDKLKKRTNNQNRIYEYVFVSVLPVILAIWIFTGGTEKTLEKILYAGAYMSNPEMIFTREDYTQKDSLDEMVVSDNMKDKKIF